MMNNFSSFLRKKGMKIKETVIMHPLVKRTNYFRGDNMLELCTLYSKEICKIFGDYNIEFSSSEEITAFLSMYTILYKPV